MLYLVIVVLVVVAVAIGLPILLRTHRPDEVDRFHIARSLTTTWATEPPPTVQLPAAGEQPDQG